MMAARQANGASGGVFGPNSSAGKWLLAIMLAAAAAARVFLWSATDFPINDGGPFAAIIDQTATVFPALSPNFDWNGQQIPFAYPPLGFWIGALLKTAGIHATVTMHVLPIAMNIGFVSLFALLLLRDGRSHIFAAVAVLFLSTSLRSFEWLVMGGGLTRGLGSLFLMSTLVIVTVPGPRRNDPLSSRRAALAGAAVAGAVLSHLEWGLLTAGTLIVSRALSSRTIKEFLVTTAIAGFTALALVAPWLAWLLSELGPDPLRAASGTSGWNLKASTFNLIHLGVGASYVNPFILIGGLVLLWRRQFFWLVFMGLCLFLTPRHGETPLALSYAFLGAQGVVTASALLDGILRRRTLALAFVTLAVAAIGIRQAYISSSRADDTVRSISREARSAMAWVAANHRNARFAVHTERSWQVDRSAEWFAYVAQAQSVNTVQGREWLPDGAFDRSVVLAERLRTSPSCPTLRTNLQSSPPFEFVWAETMQHCFIEPSYQRVYHNPRVSIFRFVGSTGIPAGPA